MFWKYVGDFNNHCFYLSDRIILNGLLKNFLPAGNCPTGNGRKTGIRRPAKINRHGSGRHSRDRQKRDYREKKIMPPKLEELIC